MAHFFPRVLRSSTDTVTAYDHGAQVAEWVHEGTPVVWVSDQAVYENGRSIRGGIPICWPWFASGPDGDIVPAHGFLRFTGWEHIESTESSVRWAITSEAVAAQPGAERFPHAFRAEVTARLDDGLEVALTVHNTGDSPFDYEVALHTYLHVADIQMVTIDGLDGVDYWDKVTRSPATQKGSVRFTGHTDRIYDSPGPVTVHDPVLERTIVLESSGASHTVVWNPWEAAAAELSDMAVGSWRRMVCVEAAVIGAESIRLGVGERRTISQRIAVQSNSPPLTA